MISSKRFLLVEHINLTSTSRYKFRKVRDASRYKVLECVGRISVEDFNSLGRNGYVLFVAKDSQGIKLQAQSYNFQVQKILQQRVRQSMKTVCSVSRKPSGVSKLIVSNTESKFPLDVNIEVKRLTRQTSFLESYYNEIIGNKSVPAKSVLSIVDGTVNS